MHSCPLLRRGTAWAMLALYGLMASGLPLPLGAPPAGSAAATKLAGKDRSQPFPCMDKACGCDSAERCFTNCCCHTPAETLAWAQARGIDPSVIAALSRRVAAASPAPVAMSCCSAKPSAPSCCSSDDAGNEKDAGICSDYQSLAADPSDCCSADAVPTVPADIPEEHEPASRVVTLRAMLACGGIVAQWVAMGTSLPPPAVVTCDLPWPQVSVLTLVDAMPLGVGNPPDLPPPRSLTGC